MASNEHHNEVRPIMDPTKIMRKLTVMLFSGGSSLSALFCLWSVGLFMLKNRPDRRCVCTGINSIHGDGRFIQT